MIRRRLCAASLLWLVLGCSDTHRSAGEHDDAGLGRDSAVTCEVEWPDLGELGALECTVANRRDAPLGEGSCSGAAIEVDADGRIHLLWMNRAQPGSNSVVLYAREDDTGDRTISAGPVVAGIADFRLDPRGRPAALLQAEDAPVGLNYSTPEVWDVESWTMLSSRPQRVAPMTIGYGDDGVLHALFSTTDGIDDGFTVERLSHTTDGVTTTQLDFPAPAVVRALSLDSAGRPNVLYQQDATIWLRGADGTPRVIPELAHNPANDWQLAHGSPAVTYIRRSHGVYTDGGSQAGALAEIPQLGSPGCIRDFTATDGQRCEHRASAITRPLALLGTRDAALTLQAQRAECGSQTWVSTPESAYPGRWSGEIHRETRLLIARYQGAQVTLAPVPGVDMSESQYKLDAALDPSGSIHVVLGDDGNGCNVQILKIDCAIE